MKIIAESENAEITDPSLGKQESLVRITDPLHHNFTSFVSSFNTYIRVKDQMRRFINPYGSIRMRIADKLKLASMTNSRDSCYLYALGTLF